MVGVGEVPPAAAGVYRSARAEAGMEGMVSRQHACQRATERG